MSEAEIEALLERSAEEGCLDLSEVDERGHSCARAPVDVGGLDAFGSQARQEVEK